MERRLNASTALDPRWTPLSEMVHNHPVWKLPRQLQPTVHLRRKAQVGATFSSWMFVASLGINQSRSAGAAAGSLGVADMERLVGGILDHAHELGLFGKAILDELEETDPEACLFDEDPSHQPWALMVPPPLRMMLDQGLARVAGGQFIIGEAAPNSQYQISYKEEARTHHEIESFELSTSSYRYFYGKSTHSIRIYNQDLPLTAQEALFQLPLSQVVDVEFFHHPSLVVTRIEKAGAHLVLHLPHILCPSARPPS